MNAQRSLLYLSPYFPPDTRVGALRPLKFVRHLPAFGYRPVVLADTPRGPADARLLSAIPERAVIHHDYGWRSRQRFRSRDGGAAPAGLLRWLAAPLRDELQQFLARPELVPLGPHGLDVPHALVAARRLIARYDCRAILVNADPFAAAVAGALLARQQHLPLVADFRDPWALCHLRRPLRKPWVLKSTDALERFVVESAARVILNSESARRDYARHYSDLPAERFVCLPNHADPTLHEAIPPERGPSAACFSLLFAGSLRRFVDGEVLLSILAALARRGLGPERVGLTLVGPSAEAFLNKAAAFGVSEYVKLEAPVSYLDVQAVQRRADLLVVLGHRDQQRIPAKIYDYALSDRPLLVVSDNPELSELSARIGGARVFGHEAVEAMADYVMSLESERIPTRIERTFGWTSRAATEKLAEILEQAGARR